MRDQRHQFAILERRKNVCQRYLRRESQWTIAQSLGVDQSVISTDLKAIRKEWVKSAVADFGERQAEELAKVDEIERAAWIGWAKSQEDAQTLVAEVSEQEEAADAKKKKAQKPRRQTTKQTTKGQAGDPRFLAIILKAIERRCTILGLDAAKRLQITGLNIYANLSDAELDERIAVAQARVSSALGSPPAKPGGDALVEAAPRPPNAGQPEQG
jgi:hypothetical protein